MSLKDRCKFSEMQRLLPFSLLTVPETREHVSYSVCQCVFLRKDRGPTGPTDGTDTLPCARLGSRFLAFFLLSFSSKIQGICHDVTKPVIGLGSHEAFVEPGGSGCRWHALRRALARIALGFLGDFRFVGAAPIGLRFGYGRVGAPAQRQPRQCAHRDRYFNAVRRHVYKNGLTMCTSQ